MFLERVRSLRYHVRADGATYALSYAGREVGHVGRRGNFAEFIFVDKKANRPQKVTSIVALDVTTEALVARLRRDIDAWRFAKPIRTGKTRQVRDGIPRPNAPVQKHLPSPTGSGSSKRSLPLTGAAAKAWASHLAQKPKRPALRDEAQWHGAQARKWKKVGDLHVFDDVRHEDE